MKKQNAFSTNRCYCLISYFPFFERLPFFFSFFLLFVSSSPSFSFLFFFFFFSKRKKNQPATVLFQIVPFLKGPLFSSFLFSLLFTINH